jgi:hypothetical protein
MAWGADILRFPKDGSSINDVPHNWRPEPLGSPEQVNTVFERLFPGDTRGDHCVLRGPDFYIEFNYQPSRENPYDQNPPKDDRVEAISMRSNGGAEAAEAVFKVCNAFENAQVCTGNLFFTLEAIQKSMGAFMAYRERAVPGP